MNENLGFSGVTLIYLSIIISDSPPFWTAKTRYPLNLVCSAHLQINSSMLCKLESLNKTSGIRRKAPKKAPWHPSRSNSS